MAYPFIQLYMIRIKIYFDAQVVPNFVWMLLKLFWV